VVVDAAAVVDVALLVVVVGAAVVVLPGSVDVVGALVAVVDVLGCAVDVVVVVVEAIVLEVAVTDVVVVDGSSVVVGSSSVSVVVAPSGSQAPKLARPPKQNNPGQQQSISPGIQRSCCSLQHRPSEHGIPRSHTRFGPQAPWHGTSSQVESRATRVRAAPAFRHSVAAACLVSLQAALQSRAVFRLPQACWQRLKLVLMSRLHFVGHFARAAEDTRQTIANARPTERVCRTMLPRRSSTPAPLGPSTPSGCPSGRQRRAPNRRAAWRPSRRRVRVFARRPPSHPRVERCDATDVVANATRAVHARPTKSRAAGWSGS
jgi:hypothetical protein